MRTLDFQCALITGGGGGLGRAMAEWLISQGKKVIIVGRTKSTLQEAAKEMGATSYYVLDTGHIPSIAPFIKKVIQEHPEVDCLINNAGVQRPLEVNGDAEEFLQKADQEIAINIQGPMHLAVGFLDHFKTKQHGAVIMNVSSVLGYIPTSVINPVYNGTKAWMHFWSMNLRSQLRDSNIQVVEVVPPTVATDLHRERHNPDDNKKENNPNALSVEEFMEDLTRGWKEDKEVIGAGSGIKIVARWYDEFGKDYESAASTK